MFSTLLESKRRAQRSVGSTFMSGILHLLLVTGAVYASAKTPEAEVTRDEAPTYTIVKPPDEPPPPKPLDTPPTPTPPVLKGFQTLTAPIVIPTVIPAIDMTQPPTDERLFDAAGIKGGVLIGDSTAATRDLTATFFVYEVDKVARLAPGNPEPNYPSILKQAKQTGLVKVQFVIDTTGKADMSTVKIVESTNPLFSIEVQRVLPKYIFVPAQIGKNKVRMAVELPFEFRLDPKGGGVER